MGSPSWLRWLLLAQGAYYLITALWPFLHMPSFLAVTGPKTDLWLVRTVGPLILAISLPLLLAGYNSRPVTEVLVLAIAACLALAAVDVYYVSKRVISPIYLADAFGEIVFLGGYAVYLFSR